MSRIEHSSVGSINLETNKKLGYYLLNGDVYYSKFHAMINASKNPSTHRSILNDDPIRWVFNEDKFIKFPWHEEPVTNLNELYRIRAQQLRDRYDYLRVEASGGGDSTTVIFSFLLNGIHLDEVIFRYPKMGEKDHTDNPRDTRCQNTLSEWEFAAKPLLKWIQTNFPKTKVVVDDYSEQMIEDSYAQDESWVFKTRHYLQPAHSRKHSSINSTDHKLLADTGKSIGVIYGIDKPKVCIKDGKFFLYFTDFLASHNSPEVGDYTNIASEFFYWSPDCPELLAKQGHLVKNWFSMKENLKFQNTLNWPNNNFATRTLYEQLVKGIVYPDYDANTFQVAKPTNNVYNEMDHWFHVNFKDTPIYNTWKAGIDYITTNLDSQYLGMIDGEIKNIKGYQSPFYYLGDSTIQNVSAFSAYGDLRRAMVDTTKYVHVINGRLSIY